jgi:hypothetical protein
MRMKAAGERRTVRSRERRFNPPAPTSLHCEIRRQGYVPLVEQSQDAVPRNVLASYDAIVEVCAAPG